MFKSVAQAFNFAFTVSENLICKTTNYVDTINGTGDRVTPQDLHAQGAFIYNQMARLNEDEYLLIHAQFSYDSKIKFDAAKALSDELVSPRIKPVDLALEMTRRHFDPIARVNKSQRAVAYDHLVSQWAIQKHEKTVAAIMCPIWLRAEAKLAEQFELNGLIEVEAIA